MKNLIITEKPSVARAFANALNVTSSKREDGYIENDEWVITWCVGHLVTLSMPEKYDENLKKWSLSTLPFIPDKFLYEVISSVSKQFNIVKKLLNRNDIGVIYQCGDSAREGEYIQRLVFQEAGTNPNASMKRVWIDSQTDEEILRGIKEAKPLSDYDNLAKSGYLRAKEDYLFGINFSRLLTLLYGNELKGKLNLDKCYISIGRVMTCVLGMIVSRENEILNFQKKEYYGVNANVGNIETSWKVTEKSMFFNSPLLYNENGFNNKDDAEKFIKCLESIGKLTLKDKKTTEEKKYAPLLYNLAELQSECSKKLKISPNQTLEIVQKLYEGKRVTYPRTDARVLSSAISKEIYKNLSGLAKMGEYASLINPILTSKAYSSIGKSKYCDDSKISDHYAIIPTGLDKGNGSYTELDEKVYDMIAKRVIAIFYPCAIYEKTSLSFETNNEMFYATNSVLKQKGYLEVLSDNLGNNQNIISQSELDNLCIGNTYNSTFALHSMETKSPSRYSSGSIILAMENAGKLIEEEELREQIKDCGIGTSATRGAILDKLVNIGYIALNKKTQILTPTSLGTEIVNIVYKTIPSLLSPKLTANWEQGLEAVSKGTLEEKTYYDTLVSTVVKEVNGLLANKPQVEITSSPTENEQLSCPLCTKGFVKENSKAFYCTEYKNGCPFTVWKNFKGMYTLTKKDLKHLLTKGSTSKVTLKKKDGTTFQAKLIMGDYAELELSFK